MLIPRYYFADDYADFYEYFLSHPHIRKRFRKHEYLWAPGEPLTHVYYIISGIALTSLEHEDGFRKISSMHSKGTLFPGCHQVEFKIEQSIVTTALSEMEVLSFTKAEMLHMFYDNRELSVRMLNWYAAYIIFCCTRARIRNTTAPLSSCVICCIFFHRTVPKGAVLTFT